MVLIILTYLAGVLTILSPCILPVLPFVFSRSQKSFTRSGLPLLAGMCLTFSLFSALAIVGGEWIGQANEWGRIFAMVLLTIFGLSLIFPDFSEKLLGPLTRVGSKIGGQSKNDSIGGSFLIGVSTGLLWAPCAGPILGLVLTGAAAQGNLGRSIALLLSYSLGAATSLSLALVAGNRFLNSLKKFLKLDRVVKKVLGIAVLLGVIAIFFNLDRTVLTQVSKIETINIEKKLLSFVRPEKMAQVAIDSGIQFEGMLPELTGAIAWLNSKPLTREELRGKVVVIDFWTYSCINCLRSLPYIKAWSEKYKNDDLIIIGVHTPEFAFEKNRANVEAAVKDLKIPYPVAIDSDYKIWNAFHNEYWPAHYFIDREGRIRHHHFGEGEYEESEKVIQKLLTENGSELKAQEVVIAASGVQAPGSENMEISPETYLGYGRAQNFVGTPALQKDQVSLYKETKNLESHHWSLSGSWQVAAEVAISKNTSSKILYRFHARDVHLVLGGPEKIKFKVKIDGKPPGPNHGIDVDENGMGVIDSHRLYQLIRFQDNESKFDHLFEIEFLAPEAEAYAFTFG